MFEVNFWGAFRVLQAVVPSMRENKKGHIQFVSTIAERIAAPYHEVYVAPKSAFISGLKAMYPVLLIDNITVSVIEPGPVENTELFAKGAKTDAINPYDGAIRKE